MVETSGGSLATVLAVDFGSSNTAAAYRDSDGRIHEVRLSSIGALMPSAVLWSPQRVLVGQSAVQAMLSDPDGFEPSPKRRLADGEILLGDQLVPVTDLVAAVLREVVSRATRVMGEPADRVVLTHPDKWSRGQQQQLADAAVAAGVARERISLVSEATAAAQFYTATGRELPVGARVAVCDFGAGTVDVAVLDKQADGGFAVVAADGVDGLGGHDLDARVHTWVRRQLATDDPLLAAELDNPSHTAIRLSLTDRVRDAKEALSETTTASVVVSGQAGTRMVQLTRDEFDALIAADVDRAVELTRRVLADANAIRSSTASPTIYLAGGTSAIPLIHDRLAELGSIATLGDPKTVVCQGALHVARADPDPSVLRTAPAPPSAPARRPAAPVTGPASRTPMPFPTRPVPAVSGGAPNRRRRTVLIAGAAVAVLSSVIAAAALTRPTDTSTSTTTARATESAPSAGRPARGFYGEQQVLPFTGISSPAGVAVDTVGRVYVADQGNDRVVMLAPGSREQTTLPFTDLDYPSGVAVDSTGAVYVTDTFNRRVVMLAAGSRDQTVLPFSDLNAPAGVAVGASGVVYVAEPNVGRVLLLAPGSREQTVLPFADLVTPTDVAVDAVGAVYVSDSHNKRVVTLAPGSREQTVLPFTDLIGADAVAVDAAGSVYVAERGNGEVVKLSGESREQSVVPFGQLNLPSGLAVDAAGEVYVSENGNSQVVTLPLA